MGIKGSWRRDAAITQAEFDAAWERNFGARITVSPAPQTEREIPAPKLPPCEGADSWHCYEHLTEE